MRPLNHYISSIEKSLYCLIFRQKIAYFLGKINDRPLSIYNIYTLYSAIEHLKIYCVKRVWSLVLGASGPGVDTGPF